MSFLTELKRRHVIRAAAAYLVMAWLVVQVVETILPAFGYSNAAVRIVVLVLAAGFIPAMILSWIYELTSEGLTKDEDVVHDQATDHRFGRKLDFVIIGMLVVALAYFGFDKFVLDPGRDAQATISIVAGLAEVRELVGHDRYAHAYARAQELNPLFTSDELQNDLWTSVSLDVPINSDPAGADLWTRPYNSTEDDWEYVGRTPLESARLPLGMARLRFELSGYDTLRVSKDMSDWWIEDFTYQLDPLDWLPDDMVRVQSAEFEVHFPGIPLRTSLLPDFLVDRYEVTNSQYQRFVDSGGYSDSKYWPELLKEGETTYSFADAMKLFVDRTGRPGPANWELGHYPDGMADHPVGGLSWFEAVAYARFAGKQLLTLYHWYWAARPYTTQFVTPESNFGDDGTAPVGTFSGTSLSDGYDMAGNVREWVWNRSENGRFVLGGGWDDPEYMFSETNAQSAFDRDELNGLRLMVTAGAEVPEFAYEEVRQHHRDFLAEDPVTDEIFDVYRSLYTYDNTPLMAQVIAVEQTEHWSRETIEFDAAYGSERITAFLYLPSKAEPPYTPVVYFPSSDAVYTRDAPEADDFVFQFLVRSGYAVIFPMYKGTYSRESAFRYVTAPDSTVFRDHVIQWSKDLARSIDYLRARPDISQNGLGYIGLSWGSEIAPIMIAIEPRITASVLVSGGLLMDPMTPEVDPFNYLPRVLVPTRMINIPNDFMFSLDNSQGPFYEYIGADVKDHVLLKGGHLPPMNDIARETLDWFDRHLDTAQ